MTVFSAIAIALAPLLIILCTLVYYCQFAPSNIRLVRRWQTICSMYVMVLFIAAMGTLWITEIYR